jgi:SAM-dependent methyltransferase
MPDHKYNEVKSYVNDEIFLVPRWLPQEYLKNCILLSDRTELLRRLPCGGVVAEVGTQVGKFAKEIMEIINPREFHIFDLSFAQFQHSIFESRLRKSEIILHEGDSATEMSKLPTELFDWIYIDGNHFFEGVSRDIREAKRLIKPDGFLIFDDYTIYSPLEHLQYGVMRAVNDLCLDENFEIFMFALDVRGYHDVACRRRVSPALVV